MALDHNLLSPEPSPTTTNSGPAPNPLIPQGEGPEVPLPSSPVYKVSPKAGSQPFSEPERLRALAIYAETGNATVAAQAIQADASTVAGWIRDPDTPSLLDTLRSTIRYQYGHELAAHAGEALAYMRRRMAEGDPHVMKDGRIVYKPVSYRDALIGMSVAIDKWALVSGALSQSNAIAQGLASIGDKLGALGASLTGAPSPPPSPDPKGPGEENLVG